jgi:hypothetical protein
MKIWLPYVIINNKNWKTQKKTICNSKQAGLGPTTQKKQNPPTAYELTNVWIATKTTRNVG